MAVVIQLAELIRAILAGQGDRPADAILRPSVASRIRSMAQAGSARPSSRITARMKSTVDAMHHSAPASLLICRSLANSRRREWSACWSATARAAGETLVH